MSKVITAIDTVLNGRVASDIRARRGLGETYAQVTAAIADTYGVNVTAETVRTYCIRHGIEGSAA